MNQKEYIAGRKKLMKSIVIGTIIPFVSLLVTLAILIFISNQQAAAPKAENSITAAAPQPKSLESSTLFFGNTFWGRYINDWSMASDLKTAYPFSRLNEFNRNQYNAWFAGLECPTVPGDTMSSAEMDETLSFNCPPEYLIEAKKWFNGFTLANNHTDNRGVEGFNETKRQLDLHNIQYFGHYDPYNVEDLCEVIAYPVTVIYDDNSKKDGNVPVAMCGYHMVFKLAPKEAYEVIEKYSKYMPVIAFPHMGKEYQTQPDTLKTQTHRNFIDYGADFVLGDHPHYIQTAEAYKGKLIVHSMGNFMFDQQDSLEVTRSAAVRVDINTSSDMLIDWLEIGEKCGAHKDNCLELIAAKKLEKLNYNYTFSIVGTDDSNKIAKPATEAQQASILQRLRWSDTILQLEQPYKGK